MMQQHPLIVDSVVFLIKPLITFLMAQNLSLFCNGLWALLWNEM